MTGVIYQIRIGKYFYYGSTNGFDSRKRKHQRLLDLGTHPNPKMQNVYDKYQEFEMFIVEEVEVESLLEVEQVYIDDNFEIESNLNIARFAMSPMKGRRHSKESREKIASTLHGRKHSEESVKKMSEKQKGRTFSAEHRAKLSASAKDRFADPTYRAKHSQKMRGRMASSAARKRMSEAAKNRKKSACRHCGKLCSQQTVNRWHNDNCKLKP